MAFSPTNITLIVFTLLSAGICFHPQRLRQRAWQATVTPLASIIGSGFLVVGPILATTVGRNAWIAMAALCATGYFYGIAIRHNIAHIEPQLGKLPPVAAFIERASDFALAVSYFVSVAYYLNLFAAFGLRMAGLDGTMAIRAVATLAIALIGVVGLRGGLNALERVEVGAVGVKLAVIGGLLASLSLAFGIRVHDDALISAAAHASQQEMLRTVLGLIILVQGFETSRYLGAEYDAKLRIRTMRHAQWISSAIYMLFVFMLTHLFAVDSNAERTETAIIDMLRPLGAAAAPLLIIAALASQSSAAVADMNGAGGLLNESSQRKIPVKLANLVTAIVAIAITWSANIFEIITYASKSFMAYYALQSLQAALFEFKNGRHFKAGLFALGVLLAVIVILWAVPADA